MTNPTSPVGCITLVTLLVCAATTVGAQPAPETAFTFQARVMAAGSPADGSYDIEAALFDSPSGCCQVGSTQSLPGVWIADGSVTLELDFGALGNDAVWLEIRLRPAGGGAMTTLTPRFLLTPAPLATRALSAAEADTADDADLLEGQPASFYMEWANHIGVPGDLADGDNDAAAALSCAAGQIAVWGAGAWTCGDDTGVRYTRTHVVAPVGDPAANGAALLAVMNGITEPTAAHEAQLVKIEPGRYDLGSQSLQMKNWVDVEGSGQLTTVIASSGLITVLLTSDCEVRNLSVENSNAGTGGGGTAISGVWLARCRLTDVTARATGASDVSEGVYLDCDDFVVRRVTVNASGGTNLNRGLYASASTGGLLQDVVAHADGGAEAIGIMVSGCEEARSIESRGLNGATGTQGAQFGSCKRVIGATAVASSSTGTSTGLYINWSTLGAMPASVSGAVARGDVALALQSSHGGTVEVSNSTLEGATIGATLALYLSGTLVIQNSTVSGATNTIANPGGTIRVAGSRLLGGPVSGTVTCAGVSDETHTFYPSTCP